MLRSKSIATLEYLEGGFEGDGDWLKAPVREVMQQALETEMEAVLGTEKSEPTEERLDYRSGYHSRTLITRAGKLELRAP